MTTHTNSRPERPDGLGNGGTSPAPADDELVAAFRRAFGSSLMAIVLFGSRARGGAQADSDIDLLIVLDGPVPGPLRFRDRFLAACPEGWRSLLAPVPISRVELSRHISSLFFEIAVDGRVLYDPSGEATSALARLRDLLDREHLTRIRTVDGFEWQRVAPPSPGIQP